VDGILVGNPNRKDHMRKLNGVGTEKLGIFIVKMWTGLCLKTDVFKSLPFVLHGHFGLHLLV